MKNLWKEASIELVALILALGISSTIVLLAVETILHKGTITEQEANLLSTVLGAVVGALATFLGLRHSGEKKSE